MSKKQLVNWLETNRTTYEELALRIWNRPEVAYAEAFASKLQSETLEAAGFRITSGIGGVPTAFVAEYGSGGPVLGILGEYDALPGLSQKVSAVREPITPGGPGHGCGHNLLGTAGVEAVTALKQSLDEAGLSGTIRYYGCPAEEVLSGKTFMARAGAFDDLDAALTWHPGNSNAAWSIRTSALTSVEFFFKGRAAHAGVVPHLGRSALDAVELTNVGANYLREHVPDGSRIHYTITNGGEAPNIVPDEASVWYYLRGVNRKHVDELLERLIKIAQGGALMTETSVTWEIKAGAYDLNINESLNQLLVKQQDDAGELSFSAEDQELATALATTLDPDLLQAAKKRHQEWGKTDELLPTGFYENRSTSQTTGGGSSDVGDVSWITPVGQITTTCAPLGVQVHTWQATAAFGSPIGLKGMHHAAKLLALAAYELLTDGGEALNKARTEFLNSTQGKPYIPAIPQDVHAPVLI
ncbi:amidohydrolase [Paenibacillus sp. NPDC056722]|uniref:amidohydrolase n=1 Tax=Paenibacillus sp. NPDC056722 TaxID=3345924 RepID=UPI0036A594AC